LKQITGATDLKYTSTADKVAEEIITCAVAYHSENNGLEKIMAPFMKLKNLLEKQRSETIDNAQAMLAEAKPLLRNLKNAVETPKVRTTASPADVAGSLIQKAQTIAVGRAVKQKCEEHKKNLKKNGPGGFYLEISTKIASDALNMTLGEINHLVKINAFATIQRKREDVLAVVREIDTMDLTSEFRDTLNKIKEAFGGSAGGGVVNPPRKSGWWKEHGSLVLGLLLFLLPALLWLIKWLLK
jgi:hypothetical protein